MNRVRSRGYQLPAYVYYIPTRDGRAVRISFNRVTMDSFCAEIVDGVPADACRCLFNFRLYFLALKHKPEKVCYNMSREGGIFLQVRRELAGRTHIEPEDPESFRREVFRRTVSLSAICKAVGFCRTSIINWMDRGVPARLAPYVARAFQTVPNLSQAFCGVMSCSEPIMHYEENGEKRLMDYDQIPPGLWRAVWEEDDENAAGGFVSPGGGLRLYPVNRERKALIRYR